MTTTIDTRLTRIAAATRPTTLTAARAALKATGLKQTLADQLIAEAERLELARNEARRIGRIARHLGYTPIEWGGSYYRPGLWGRTSVYTPLPVPRLPGDPTTRADGRRPVVLPKGTPAERLDALRKATVERAYARLVRVGTNDEIDAILVSDPRDVGLLQPELIDRSAYKGKYKGWAMRYRRHAVYVPRDWRVRVERQGLASVDGMMTLDAAPLEGTPEGVELFAARWIVQGRGNAASVARGYIARSGGLTYHGHSIEEALRGIARKTKAAAVEHALQVADLSVLAARYPDVMVRVQDARAIGACDYGIRSWCWSVGLDLALGEAPVAEVYEAYKREPRAEARAAILHALRRARKIRPATV